MHFDDSPLNYSCIKNGNISKAQRRKSLKRDGGRQTAMKLPQPSKSAIYFILTFGLFLCARPVEVNIKETVIFPCNETCNGQLLWTFETDNEELDVLKCDQNACTEGDSFKYRASFKPGALSPTLYPVLYNDEGLYVAYCNAVFLCQFHLKVLVPATVSASVNSNITLHCYARTKKQVADDTVNVLWKKDDQIVFQVKNGITTYGPGFKGRASVSLPHYKDGDLSLNIHGVTTSDQGLFRCYHGDTDEHGYPGAVSLNVIAGQNFYAKTSDDLHLDLFGSDRVKVTFTSHMAEALVCDVTGSYSMCSPDYSNRVSVTKGFLVVHDVTSSDTGTFIVRDETGEVVGVHTVTVEGVPRRRYFIPVSVVSVFAVICVCLIVGWRCHRQSQAQQYRCSYNTIQSGVEILREPACIGLSQQETEPEPEVRARTPVEETMPETVRTTEKQDDTEEYITTGNGFEETIWEY
ncbi:uncharacterized protein si:dkey-22i16.9 [Puntigrus tetrazona]|uniref:uncharacterized protein si:dkey-22i16.9 n=1 Tax=Puntigrus tetrazona TaxID=1606681 RepID=UPI001C8AE405|nr:uncharacterized protein si:dkey-22i16.9 [Puntigrus tetrazona]